MARNVNETEADEAEQGVVTSRDAFLDVLGTVSAAKGKISKLTGNVSALLNKAENDHNLDKKAFAIIHWATRQEPTRVNAFLRHFDAYREYADLDNMAGADMFEGAPKGSTKAAGKANGNGTQTAAKAKTKPTAAPKGGKPRGRPKKVPEQPSAAEAAAVAWGLEPTTETAGAA